MHAPPLELWPGRFGENFDRPDRAVVVRNEIISRKIGPVLEPQAFPLRDILRVHGSAYLDFLQKAHEEWKTEGHEGDAFGFAFNVQHPGSRPPTHIYAKLGVYTGDGTVPLTATSWQAISESAFSALTARRLIQDGERAAFALCRPCGHHATVGAASGYSYLNNAAIAAQAFIDGGAGRVAILDVDYHHGNGTQEIFYGRRDVLLVSVHADPACEYPYFAGFEHERGRGDGEGFTVNYPLPFGTRYEQYKEALAESLKAIAKYGPDFLIVSLGVDTFRLDPISKFLLESDDYLKMGEAIGSLSLPTLFVMEGGYAVEEIGVNVANVLEGFSGTGT